MMGSEGDEMALSHWVGHLQALRRCLLSCAVVIAIVLGIFLYFANELFYGVALPLIKALPGPQTLVAISMTGTFLAPLKWAFWLSVMVVMPFILFQLWSFIVPGLYRGERVVIWPLLVLSTFLFYLGMAFAYYFVFPLLFRFFVMTAPQGVTVMPDIEGYLELILSLFFSFGLAFETPVMTILLVRVGLVSLEGLRALRPYVVVGAFIVGMLLTPPDVVSQVCLAVPLYILFELGLGLARFFLPARSSVGEGGRPAD